MIFKICSYLKEEERRINALEWDKKEKELELEFQKRRMLAQEKWKTSETDTIPEKYEPQEWKPTIKKRERKVSDL